MSFFFPFPTRNANLFRALEVGKIIGFYQLRINFKLTTVKGY